MKIKTLFASALAVLAFTACNLDFKNASEDKWMIVNYSTVNTDPKIKIIFSDNSTPVTIDAATKTENTIKPAVITVERKADASFEIDTSFHVDTEASYSYTETPAIRKLIIKDQNAYIFTITNNTDADISLDFILNYKSFPNDLDGTATTEENEKKYTISITKNDSKTITIYKNSPTFTFYKSGTTEKIQYTINTDTSGKSYITIK